MSTTTTDVSGVAPGTAPAAAPKPAAASPAPLSYTSRPPRRGRRGFNWRLVVFLAAIAAPFLAIGYVFVSYEMTGGVTNHGDYASVDLKALGNFPFDQANGTINDIPERYRKLDGKRVVLDGYMWAPTSAGPRGTQFQFVYNVAKCCFGGPPQVQERVYGYIPPAKRDEIQIYDSWTFVQLTGVLHVRVVRDGDGVIRSVYDMDVEKAEARS
jgi:hypothetical protein